MSFDIQETHEQIRGALPDSWDTAIVGTDAIVAFRRYFGGTMVGVHIRFVEYPAFTSSTVTELLGGQETNEFYQRVIYEALDEGRRLIDSILNPPPPPLTPEEELEMARGEWESERTLRLAEALGPDGWRIHHSITEPWDLL